MWSWRNALALAPALAWGSSNFAPSDIIVKDVAIIGGGGSGTYAAVRLREDYNKSIVVIEKNDRLGGHVNTYHDPVTNTLIDYGVETYLRYGNSAAFFSRFNIPIKPYPQSSATPVYVDTANGALLANYTPPSPNASIAAFETWNNLTAKYADLITPGFWDFPNGSSIPEELLTPFGEIAQKYNLSAAVPTMMTVSNVGVGGIDDILTLYVMLAFGYPITKEFLANSLFIPANGSNSLLYERALALLHEDVLLETVPVAAERNATGAQLVVRGADGRQKLIQAKKLLVTPPPSPDNLAPLGLDRHERDVLSHWTGTWSFVGVARIPGIPANTGVYYTAPAAAPANYLAQRNWPWTLSATAAPGTNDSTFEILMAANSSLSHADAQKLITDNLGNLFAATGPFANATNTTVEWLAFGDHNSILWRQSADLLRTGFVQDLYSLQGPRSTWYTGGLWSADYSGDVWAFTDTVLPKLVASL